MKDGAHIGVGLTKDFPQTSNQLPAIERETAGRVVLAPNLIGPDCELITPDMLSLVELDQEQIDTVVQTVPGGAKNVQDIYSVSPLQEGMLFHRLLNEQSDTYVLSIIFELQSHSQVSGLINALKKVMDRHDALRTAVLWEKLPRPVQVVYRQAELPVEELVLDRDRDPVTQIQEWMRPGGLALNLRHAPLMRLLVAADPKGEKWYAVLRVHHLVCDHQSLRIVAKEAIACLEGREQALPPPVGFRNYVAQALAYAQTEGAEAFFRSKLGDVDEPTAPFGLLDIHLVGSPIEEHCQALDPTLAEQARIQARRLGVSAARLFHAAWGLVVARTSGRDDVVYGTVLLTGGQRSASAQRMLGMSVNTLPLRLRLRGVTAKELIEQTHRELAGLLNYEQASLSLAQRCSGITGATSLFTALLNYRHSAPDVEAEPASGSLVRLVARGEAWSNYPVTLIVDDLGDGFLLTAQTDRRIDPHRITGYLHKAVQSLVEALRQAPDTPSLALSILPEWERHQVIELFNPRQVPYPTEKLIHELFEQQVRRKPDAVAVVYGEHSLTYAQINSRANQLARYLRSRGVGPDQLVAICLERSLEVVVALIGILKAGGAYLPLDPNYPADRLAYMLEDAKPLVLLTQDRLRKGLPPTTAKVIVLDRDWEKIKNQLSSNMDARAMDLRPYHLAYVIYTSGSTGNPKGVMVEHRNVTRLFAATENWFHFNERDVWTLFHSLAFDFSVWELWGALLYGGRVIVVPYVTARSPQEFYGLLCAEGVTVLNQTPSAFAQLIDAQARSTDTAHSLRVVIFGGEALELRALRPWVKRNGAKNPQLVNMYGITETTVHVTYRLLTEEEIKSGRGSPIGKPIPDLRTYLLDCHGQPVPIGVTGELYVGGAGVARGYLERSELTAERFLSDPFSGDPSSRMYKSGDRGRWRPDGTIEYLGRNDHQVKIRGFRIELAEIEAQLVRDGRVKEAVVIAREDLPGDKRLVAYIVPAVMSDAQEVPSVESLRTHLKALLPEYMVPSAFVMLGGMPLTPNGKLDRRALPAPEFRAYASQHYEAPESHVEAVLAGIWQALLRVDRVGRQDNFFELGGHSLLIVQMIERLRRVGLSTEVRRVFESPRLADLASALTRETVGQFQVPRNLIPAGCKAITPQMLPLVELQAEHIERIAQMVPGGAENVQDIYPLVPLQEGILFHHLFDDKRGDTYVLSLLLAVSSRERLESVIASIQAVINRHDALRTAIFWDELPRPVQVVHRKAVLPVIEVPFDPGRKPIEQAREWMRPERQRLDLRHAPVMQLKIASDPHTLEWYALLQLHHMIIDHVTLDLITAEILAHVKGEALTLPASVPYRNHVAHTLAYARTQDAERFFRAKLASVHEPTAPFGVLDVHGHGSLVEEANQQLDMRLAHRVRTQSRRLGVSAATLFHSAWSLVIAHTSGLDDVVFGTVLSGRLQGNAGEQRTLGMFINTLPLRLRLDDVTVKELVEQTQRELVELLHHEQASLAMVQRCSGIAGSVPLFTTLFNYRHSLPNVEAAWSSAPGVRMLAFQERTNYPIVLSVDDFGKEFAITAQTDRRVDPHRVTGCLHAAVQSLVEALEQEEQKLALSLQTMPENERYRVTVAFNETKRTFPQERLIHEIFEEQVQRRPDAVALVYEDDTLTYAGLNSKANQLAHYLSIQGVHTGECIPILMPRCIETTIAQLAVLKSGGIYVPIDPSLPVERQALMIRDCGARRVLAGHGVSAGLQQESIQWVDCSALTEIASMPKRNLGLQMDARRAAYVMYTSGSSGVPKGVVVPHSAVNRLVLNNGYAQIEPNDCIAHCSNPAFDASTFEIWAALLNGASVLIVPQSVVLEPLHFAEALSGKRVTVMWLTVGLFAQYSDALATVFRQLRYLITGGDIVEPSVISRVLRNSPPGHLLTAYGPTECTTFSTTYLVEAVDGGTKSIPIGRPISNTQIYILDHHLQPVSIGVTGQIYIGGAGVALGYLNRPEWTAEHFIPDPFSSDREARLYKSGDLGRWRTDGNIEFLGRKDQQLKLRGFRVELGEIEAQLARHRKVMEAAVVAQGNDVGGKRLVAYVRRRGESNPTAKELRAYLETVLPEYMLPTAFVILERFPLTANGKVDRRALPEPELEAYARQKYEAPQGAVEQALAGIWRELLQIDQVGREDNFFSLGGHSLLVLKALFGINHAFQCALSVRDVYRSPTLRELAARICGEAIGDELVDLRTESRLDDNIVAKPGLRRVHSEAVLLTGGTGFVGRFLLAQLLQDTRATIYCLVRASSQHQALSRLRAALEKWDLWRDEFDSRIIAIPGDLRLPRLGVDDIAYSVLSENVARIYHCATSMNHLETYAMANAANVESARELLKLATIQAPKLINYISTLSVFSSPAAGTTRIVDETSPIDFEQHSISSGYAASKWVGEKIFMIASERGIPCNIFRLGLVWADSRQGRYDELQREYRIIKSCLLSGCGIANYRYEMPPTPVDYVAQAVVYLANRHCDGNGIFHISSSSQMIEGVFECCNEVVERSIELVSYYDWICEVKRLHGEGRSLPVVPLIEFAFSMDEGEFWEQQRRIQAARMQFDCTRTHRELERAGIAAPALCADLLRVCLDSMFSRDPELQDRKRVAITPPASRA